MKSAAKSVACAFVFLLGAMAAKVACASAMDLSTQTIVPTGTTYSRAQVLDWIDDTRFAVGRWDGTVSIFRVPGPGEYGPVIEQAWAARSGRGVEMLTAIDGRIIVVSDGSDRLSVWRKHADKRFEQSGTQLYDVKFGAANSGAALSVGDENWFVSGHESGHMLIWKRRSNTKFTLMKSIDLRSSHPIPAQYPLKNIRDLVRWRDHYLIAASEDGDLVAVDIPSGAEIFRHRYNVDAKRGINDIAVIGDWLLVANCAVGADDRNLWLFDLSGGTPRLSDSANLVVDTQRSQTFNFEVEFIGQSNNPGFFSSTEEGVLWRGEIKDGQLILSGVTKVSSEGGAVLDKAPSTDMLAAAAHQILLFKQTP
jgi:hypothetical protein